MSESNKTFRVVKKFPGQLVKQDEKDIHPYGRITQWMTLGPKREEDAVPKKRQPEWDIRA